MASGSDISKRKRLSIWQLSPWQFKYWAKIFAIILRSVLLFAIYTWFIYTYLSVGPTSIIGNVFATIILGGGLLSVLVNFLFAIYFIILGAWKLITGQVSEPEKNTYPEKSTYDVSEAGEVEVYDFRDWWNAIGSLVFGIIAVPIGIALISVAMGPAPEAVAGTNDPIVLWGFAIIWIFFSLIALIRGIVGTVRGVYLLFKAREKRIG